MDAAKVSQEIKLIVSGTPPRFDMIKSGLHAVVQKGSRSAQYRSIVHQAGLFLYNYSILFLFDY